MLKKNHKKLTEKAQKIHSQIAGNPVDVDLKLLKEMMHECPYCGKKLVPAVDLRAGEVSKFILKADCECLSKKFRVSFG